MARLRIVARNVCGSKAPFRLLGKEPKEQPDEPGAGAVIELVPRGAPDMHTVIDLTSVDKRTARPIEIWPGDIYVVEHDLDYDVSSLDWTTPPEHAGKFQLLELSWAGRNLLANRGPNSGLL